MKPKSDEFVQAFTTMSAIAFLALMSMNALPAVKAITPVEAERESVEPSTQAKTEARYPMSMAHQSRPLSQANHLWDLEASHSAPVDGIAPNKG